MGIVKAGGASNPGAAATHAAMFSDISFPVISLGTGQSFECATALGAIMGHSSLSGAPKTPTAPDGCDQPCAINRARSAVRQEKLWPQPQVRCAFGFVIANPDWFRPSL